jgi:FG-GAP repeat
MTTHVSNPDGELRIDRRSFLTGAAAFAASLTAASAPAQQTAPIKPMTASSRARFKKHVINPDSDFEACCAANIAGKGQMDLVSGDTWYEHGTWKPHKFREIGVWGRSATESGYRASFADIPIDVNGDGRIDIVSSDYASGEIFWHENVGGTADLWPKHLIAKPGSAETTITAPILGKGKICILPNCAGQVVWYELQPGKEPKWIEHVVGKEGAGHGIGFGDVNGDGKTDIICPNGWYENIDAAGDKWAWHPDFRFSLGGGSIGMPVYDVDGDGRNDIVIGSGHGYGLAWYQQQGPTSPQKFVEHIIDNTWSQAHALMLADIERKGQPVILTGKRYKAHDHDPGAGEPLVLCYYAYDRPSARWTKYVIDEGTQAGTGLQLFTGHILSRNRTDILAGGKSGLYLFENQGI